MSASEQKPLQAVVLPCFSQVDVRFVFLPPPEPAAPSDWGDSVSLRAYSAPSISHLKQTIQTTTTGQPGHQPGTDATTTAAIALVHDLLLRRVSSLRLSVPALRRSPVRPRRSLLIIAAIGVILVRVVGHWRRGGLETVVRVVRRGGGLRGRWVLRRRVFVGHFGFVGGGFNDGW